MATASTGVAVPLTTEDEAALKTISENSNKFAINLYKELIKTESGNVFVSPLSVQMVLALAYTGAGGATASELKSLLSLPDSLDPALSGYLSLIKNFQDPVLKVANRMFVEKTARVKEDFQNNAKKYFLAPAEQLDFQGDPEKSREHINLWVENQTNKKIRDIITPGLIDNFTRLVLVNAIYFKDNWKFKFDEVDTRERPFHISNTEKMPVELMHLQKNLGFVTSKALSSKILELEYEGANFSMIVILPDEIDGLAELEENLDTVDLFDELKHLRKLKVKVALPKFKLEKNMDLNTILESMGAKTMFSGSANFSNLCDEPLCVSQVVQKSFVEVNEKGTEAAAVTRMTMVNLCLKRLPLPDQYFIADHPFLFAIVHETFKTILFLGRFTDPK